MKGIDCANPLSAASAKKIAAAGMGFAVRYLVPERYAWKRLTREEAEGITEAGMKIGSVFETSASRASGGASAGKADGQAALAEARAIKQPLGTAIYFAVDYDAQPGDYDAIEAYLRAAAAEIPGYAVGVYGSYSVVEAMAKRQACTHFWQTYAWSRGLKSSHANLYQYHNGTSIAGVSVDLNESFGEAGLWDTAKPATEPPYGGTFKDVPDNHYAKEATERLAEEGIISGIGNGLFGFGQSITREDAAVMVDRAVRYLEQKISQN